MTAPQRVPKIPTPRVREWSRLLMRAFKARHVRRPDKDVALKLAALLSLLGDPEEDQPAQRVYWSLVALFGDTRRRSRWEQAVDVLPPEPDKLLRIAGCVGAYWNHVSSSGRGRSLPATNLHLPRVLRVMVQIENPDQYVLSCVQSGIERPGAIFHPNTFQARRSNSD